MDRYCKVELLGVIKTKEIIFNNFSFFKIE